MNKIVTCLIVVISAILICGCAEINNEIKHLKSSAVGLNRHATVYSWDGKVIKEYEGRFKIEESSSLKTKFVCNGKSVYIVGGIVIIEEK